jgi:branched-chain amino acid transport system ATP-binding protein
VLTDIDLAIGPGEVVALFGHNGAGKTTLLRIATGLKSASAGTVRLHGTPMPRNVAARARHGLSLVPEGVKGIFPSLTVRQNLDAARPRGTDPGATEEMLHEAFGDVLVERMDQVADSMSGGQRQMLALSLALIRRPSVLLLDEPSTGLAPSVVRRIFRLLSDLPERPAMVVVEQDLQSALEIASRVLILRSGEFAAEFPREECPDPTQLWAYF